MKIIDMRCRPPYGSFLNNPSMDLYNLDFIEPFAAAYGATLPPSIYERSLEMCLQEMDAAGITRSVVPVRVAQGVKNEDIAQLLTLYPERFIGMAGIDIRQINSCFDTIERWIQNGPFQGVFMEHGYGNDGTFKCTEGTHYVNDKALYPLYEKCEREKIPVLISYGGFTAPNLTYFSPAHIDQVANDFPNLHLILAHGAWPHVQEIMIVAMAHDNLYLSPDIYMINSPGEWDYYVGANYRLSDKIIFGSAYPAIDMKQAVDYYRSKIRNEVLEKIMYQNAVKALNLNI